MVAIIDYDKFVEYYENNSMHDMPNCFKGIFTLDEFGNPRSLRDKEEVEKSWRDFWGR